MGAYPFLLNDLEMLQLLCGMLTTLVGFFEAFVGDSLEYIRVPRSVSETSLRIASTLP